MAPPATGRSSQSNGRRYQAAIQLQRPQIYESTVCYKAIHVDLAPRLHVGRDNSLTDAACHRPLLPAQVKAVAASPAASARGGFPQFMPPLSRMGAECPYFRVANYSACAAWRRPTCCGLVGRGLSFLEGEHQETGLFRSLHVPLFASCGSNLDFYLSCLHASVSSINCSSSMTPRCDCHISSAINTTSL